MLDCDKGGGGEGVAEIRGIFHRVPQTPSPLPIASSVAIDTF